MTGPLLEIDGLSIAAGPRVLLDDFSMTLDPGEFVAIVGESGSGKTLATRAIVGLLPPGITRSAGSITFADRDLDALPPAAMRHIRGNEIGMVFQEPMTSLNPAIKIGRQLDEALRLHRPMTATERRAACIAMLRRVRILDPEACLSSYPHEFSGGMRQRIMLAAVMLLKPRLLIADEPTTALDTLSQRDVMDIMAGLAAEEGTAVILITHNLGLVAQYASRAIVLEKGRMVEQGDTAQILAAPAEPYTRRLVGSLPSRGPARPPCGGDLVKVDNLVVAFKRRGYRDTFRAVDGASLTVAPGEVVAVVGGSGSGKTTLGRAVLGLTDIASGSIVFDGLDPKSKDKGEQKAFRRETQLVFQDPYSSLDPRMTVHDIVAQPLRHFADMSPADRRARTDEIIGEVGLADFQDRYPHQLSGGQRQRVAIGRALVTHPKFVVADEPVSALDASIQAQVLRLFAKLQAQHGFACLFISHDLGVVEQIADRVVVMSAGRIVEQGSRDAIFDAPRHEFTRQLLAATPRCSVDRRFRANTGDLPWA
ncbi:MAG: ABC transporter ATP-binding protein [Pseudomonadota bacterium]